MSSLASERVQGIHGYAPGEQPEDLDDLIKLNTNENPYPPSTRVRNALREGADAALQRYPSPAADELRNQAAEVYGVSPGNVLVGNGSDELLSICLRTAVADGDRVAYTVPSYSLYPTLARLAGGELVEIAATSIHPLPDALGDADAKVTFICTPNSPFGYAVDLDLIARTAERSRGVVVADEAYGDFSTKPSALELLPTCSNLMVLRSFSKSFSLAGLRLGLIFGCEPFIQEMLKVKDSYNVSSLHIRAGIAALADVGAMQTNVQRIIATRERVAAELAARGFVVVPSEANFIWVEADERGGEGLYRELREKSVLVRYFDVPELRGGVRVTIGTDAEMDRFLGAFPAKATC